MSTSPLAPEQFAELNPVAGLIYFTAPIGNGYKGRNNLLLAKLCEGTQVAGVFTTSNVRRRQLIGARRSIGSGAARGLLVNAGNANAFVGKVGAERLRKPRKLRLHSFGCTPQEIFIPLPA